MLSGLLNATTSARTFARLRAVSAALRCEASQRNAALTALKRAKAEVVAFKSPESKGVLRRFLAMRAVARSPTPVTGRP